jgi:hypothetical protein
VPNVPGVTAMVGRGRGCGLSLIFGTLMCSAIDSLEHQTRQVTTVTIWTGKRRSSRPFIVLEKEGVFIQVDWNAAPFVLLTPRGDKHYLWGGCH